MDDLLRKIDEVVKRTNCSYEEAKDALEKHDGDVVGAIIFIEKSKNPSVQVKKKGEELINEIKKIIDKGNVTKLTIKRKGETILNLPITAGAVGMIVAPFLSLVGLTTALLTECTIEVLKDDGEIICISDELNKSVNKVKEEFNDIKKSFES
jgi:hypothetical protein